MCVLFSYRIIGFFFFLDVMVSLVSNSLSHIQIIKN